MKYLPLVFSLLFIACNNNPVSITDVKIDTVTTVQKEPSPPPPPAPPAEQEVADPSETGDDTARVKAAMLYVFKLPEIQALNNSIRKATNGKHGASFIAQDGFNGDSSYYSVVVGDNSHNDRYITLYRFVMDKRTAEVKAYYPPDDSKMSISDWRKQKK